MKHKPLIETNPYLRDPAKFRKALITSVASSTAIETGTPVATVARMLEEGAKTAPHLRTPWQDAMPRSTSATTAWPGPGTCSATCRRSGRATFLLTQLLLRVAVIEQFINQRQVYVSLIMPTVGEQIEQILNRWLSKLASP
jgi:hypothetical protein